MGDNSKIAKITDDFLQPVFSSNTGPVSINLCMTLFWGVKRIQVFFIEGPLPFPRGRGDNSDIV